MNQTDLYRKAKSIGRVREGNERESTVEVEENRESNDW